MNNLQIDTAGLRNAAVGERLSFERKVPKPGLAGLPRIRDLAVDGTIEQLGDRLRAQGTVTATVTPACSRCLKEFDLALATPFTEEFSETPNEEQFPAGPETIDLGEMLRTVLVLAMPARPLHAPDCHGLCPVCGKDLNDDPHDHPRPKAKPDSPFSVLKDKRR